MNRTETLQRIKDAEAKVTTMKQEAEAEKVRILKDMRREELELQDTLRKEAEAQYNKVIAEARNTASKEREQIIVKGKHEAESVKAEGMKGFEQAVAWLVKRFKGAV